jgi:predicted TPR repeat methyltransferase
LGDCGCEFEDGGGDAPVELPSIQQAEALASELLARSPVFAADLLRHGFIAAALRRQGLAEWRAGRWSDAVDALQAALVLTLRQGGDGAELWRELAGVHEARDDHRAAEACAAAASDLRPDDPRAWSLLGHVRSRAGLAAAARTAFLRALELDPRLAEAYFGLGLLHFADRRPDLASADLERALAQGYDPILVNTVLGHVRFLAGDFAGCVRAFEAASEGAPLAPEAFRKYVRARTYAAVVAGQAATAAELFRTLAGDDGEDLDEVLRDGFVLLAGCGHHEAARAIGRLRLAEHPSDPSLGYLIDALDGVELPRAPAAYVEDYFDRFAASFDHRLVEVLGYDAPAVMAQMIGKTRRRFDHVLDLGCGTGLAAERLSKLGDRLTGVDLSGGMLEQAGRRNRYNRLVQAEAVAFLDATPEVYDLIFAADVLVYFGDLRPLFATVERRLLRHGYFALCVEATDGDGYRILPSGRFAHSATYLRRLFEPRFALVEESRQQLRLEGGRPVEGLFLVLERRP